MTGHFIEKFVMPLFLVTIISMAGLIGYTAKMVTINNTNIVNVKNELEIASKDRYTGTMANLDKRAQGLVDSEQNDEINRIWGRINALETKVTEIKTKEKYQ